MKLYVYKGFDLNFLSKINFEPLLEEDISKKLDIFLFNKQKVKKLAMSLLELDDKDEKWITYEEYSAIKNRITDQIKEDDLKVVIYKNNMFPDYYPLPFKLDQNIIDEILECLDSDRDKEYSDKCKKYLEFYNSLVITDDTLYGSFYNHEYEETDNIEINDYYPHTITIKKSSKKAEYDIFSNEDIEQYLNNLNAISSLKPKSVSFRCTEGIISRRIKDSLLSYCQNNNIEVIEFSELLDRDVKLNKEFFDIAINDIKIPGFKKFRDIKFYKHPDIDNETVLISQQQIIKEIIEQAEKSYDRVNGKKYRDIFITASTGAGKSIMFQIPAIYLAKKYKKLTIIIEPVKALMQDQKEELIKRGYTKVDAFNSDLITQVEKEKVLSRIKNGEIDLLYLSPETLLSYSIDTIIGNREIGLLIVDEAHIVTTWGVGFRPDYWYLGSYINKIRNGVNNKKKNLQSFPICAFTATAVNGGVDDTVSETITSLYMENPIKYIGYAKRDDIEFKINIKNKKRVATSEYELAKGNDFKNRVKEWLKSNEKTIVYFPYASYVYDAYRGLRMFADIKCDSRIGVYTGRNIDEISIEAFNETKRETFDKFKNNEISIMYATKAFGMGVDVNDVVNVYHFAVTGNLSDYIQEIGRAARKNDLNGYAISDHHSNDLSFMQRLWGMSQIRQYQINKVLNGIYDVFKSKKGSRNFLISPESFTYIFKGNEESSINKLKTCLLMIEKDLYDKYNYKVLISRPQSVFTKSYVVIKKEETDEILNSKYGKCFKYIQKGRYNKKQPNGSIVTDLGDIYSINLKEIWEKYYQNISFPQFKYWYFNNDSQSDDKIDIMPEIRKSIYPRQKISIECRNSLLICDLREKILEDFEYIANKLYEVFSGKYFSLEEFAKLISEKYGKTKATLIANSIFELVDPNSTCVKYRFSENNAKTTYTISNGNLKEYMRKSIIKSRVISSFSKNRNSTFSTYINLSNDEWTNTSLKLLSIFEYITYEVIGGEQPEIFIRLNDPNKINQIVTGSIKYSNNYVTRAAQKHDRDINVLKKFYYELNSNKKRWEFVEQYFLGEDVLEANAVVEEEKVDLIKAINKPKSYPVNGINKWDDLYVYFEDNYKLVLNEFKKNHIPVPEYLELELKKFDFSEKIIMSWPSKNIIIFKQDIDDKSLAVCRIKGWIAYRILEIDFKSIKKVFKK